MPASPVSAIVIPCAGKKKICASQSATAISLPRGAQSAAQDAWLRRVRALPPVMAASSLYAGRGFGLARETAQRFGAPLFVISAGLGFVPGSRLIPAYGLTVSRRGPESVVARIEGRFDPGAWWDSVANSPHSVALGECLGRSEAGLVLIALTRPYAEMVGPALADAVAASEHRVRIFGRGLGGLLPEQLESLVMPYDDRLDALIPGTRIDFSHRALSHFADNFAAGGGAVSDHRQRVLSAMAAIPAPVRLKRPSAPDEAIIARIQEHLQTTSGVGRTLRRLRDQDAIACEQSRFTRLYRLASGEGARS